MPAINTIRFFWIIYLFQESLEISADLIITENSLKYIKYFLKKYNLNNIQTLINFKDKYTGEMKVSKEKVETMSKSIAGQLDSLEKGVKSYSHMLVDTSEKNVKVDFDNLSQRLSDIRMENHRYAVDVRNTANELKIENDKILNIKKEIYNTFDLTTLNFKDLNKQTNEHFDQIKEEYDLMKKKFTEIAEFVKVFIIYNKGCKIPQKYRSRSEQKRIKTDV